MQWDTTKATTTTDATYQTLPSDTYIMEIERVALEENRFAEPDAQGKRPEQLVLTWKVAEVTAEQQAAGIQPGERVWQRLNPWYGTTRGGQPSRFKSFVDSLIAQGMLNKVFGPEDFVGIKQRVTIEEYTKGQGPNAGQPGNRVTLVMPLKPVARRPPVNGQAATIPPSDPDDLPF